MTEIVKRSLLLFVAMTAVAVAKAQFFRVEELPRNDLSLSIGFGTTPNEGHIHSCPTVNNSRIAKGAVYKDSDNPMCISFNGVYMRNILNRWGVGIQFNYVELEDYSSEDIYSNYYQGSLATMEESDFTIMPTLRCFWWYHHHWGFYTRLAAGIDFHKVKERDLNPHDDLDFRCGTFTDKDFAYQLSLVGVEVGGRRIRAFSELGYGYQGVFSLGMRVKFGYK